MEKIKNFVLTKHFPCSYFLQIYNRLIMGISIHYSGRISNKSKLSELIEEVEEISKAHNWKYHIFNRVFPEIDSTEDSSEQDRSLYGISFSPEGSEPVSFCFLSNGKMSSPMQLAAWGNYKGEQHFRVITQDFGAENKITTSEENVIIDKDEFNKMLYLCSTKTQFAGAITHEKIIRVFQYISGKYLSNFTLTDETGFWETGDRDKLEKSFKRIDYLIESITSLLQNNKQQPGEDIASIIKRISEKLRAKFNDTSDAIENNEK